MNSLQTYIRDQQLDPAATMNTLQEHGLVSDNCVTPADVFGKDNWRAISFLDQQKPKPRK